MNKVLFFIFFCTCYLANVASAEDSKLKELDALKMHNPSQFLVEIDSYTIKTEAPAEDQQYYLYLQAFAKAIQGDSIEAESLYQQAVNLNSSELVSFKAKLALANLYVLSSNYNSSLELLEDALLDIDKFSSKEVNAALLNGAIIYNEIGQSKLAEPLLNRIKDSGPLPEGLECTYYAVNAQLLSKLGRLESQVEELRRQIDVCHKKGRKVYSNLIRAFLITEVLKDKNYKAANIELHNNLNDVEKIKYNNLISIFYSQLSESYRGLNELKKSSDFALMAVKTPLTGNSSQKWLVRSYEILYLNAKESKAFEESLEFLEKFNEADKAYLNDYTAKQLAHQLAKHQTADKVRKIELLNQQNEVLMLEQDLASQSAKNNQLMVVLLIFVLASLAFWTYRVKRNQIKLKKQSETDLLTGAASRHHFYFLSRKNLEFASSSAQEVSFVLFDLDKFKSVNDNYGHLVGDWVLKKVIEVCRPCWRQNDIAGRLGGEEFALMLPTCDLDKAVEIAEKCRQAIESVDTSESGHKFNISASFGVTTSKVSGYSLQDLIGDADRVMYQAKAAGKNQVLKVASKS